MRPTPTVLVVLLVFYSLPACKKEEKSAEMEISLKSAELEALLEKACANRIRVSYLEGSKEGFRQGFIRGCRERKRLAVEEAPSSRTRDGGVECESCEGGSSGDVSDDVLLSQYEEAFENAKSQYDEIAKEKAREHLISPKGRASIDKCKLRLLFKDRKTLDCIAGAKSRAEVKACRGKTGL